jgi:predicted phosphodiesterase
MLARSDNVTPMRVALVSDIHGNLPALEAVVADIRRRGADQIVCIGDEMFPCHGTPRSDCEHFLESVRNGALSIATAAELAERLGDVRSPLVACGHSHVPRAVRLRSGQLCVNPGSVGVQAYTDDHPERYSMELGTPDAQYAIVEKSRGGWMYEHYAVIYDSAPMAALARARGRPDWEQSLLRGYVR